MTIYTKMLHDICPLAGFSTVKRMSIDPKTDDAFKQILGSSEAQKILITTIDALIDRGKISIESLSIFKTALPPKTYFISGRHRSFFERPATPKKHPKSQHKPGIQPFP